MSPLGERLVVQLILEPIAAITNQNVNGTELVDLVGIEPTTSSMPWSRKRQPEICFQVVSSWYFGQKWVYWTIFPANFRQNF
jgi:hypothetical protein